MCFLCENSIITTSIILLAPRPLFPFVYQAKESYALRKIASMNDGYQEAETVLHGETNNTHVPTVEECIAVALITSNSVKICALSAGAQSSLWLRPLKFHAKVHRKRCCVLPFILSLTKNSHMSNDFAGISKNSMPSCHETSKRR